MSESQNRPRNELRIGIDVGGTNTDAVALDSLDTLRAKVKVHTSTDIDTGIRRALTEILDVPGIEASQVRAVMIGTTQATNALLERRELRRVAALRIGAPLSTLVRPMFGWPDDLREAISAGAVIVPGGLELNGRDGMALDTDALARFCGNVAGRAQSIAVTSVFAPVSPRHELQALDIIRRELGEIPVSLSHQVGSLGLLERENSTILNAALGRVADQIIRAIEDALDAQGLGHAAAYFAQNDGTLMSLDATRRTPVLTIGSGPANSLRGAAWLSGVADAIVADVGGTSTDIGALSGTFPRESAFGVDIGGVSTNFRMPDLVSIALGGGTVIGSGPGRPVTLGPHSVGYRLPVEALVFGGEVATLSDAMVAAERADFGDHPVSAHALPALRAAIEESDRMVADAVDRVKTSRNDAVLIAVGGGSPLIPDKVPGVLEVVRPPHYDVANAIGAAMGTVSGQVDQIAEVGHGTEGRKAAVERARQAAIERAVDAGAAPSTVEVIDIEEIPLSYLNHPAIRLRVKAAGPFQRE